MGLAKFVQKPNVIGQNIDEKPFTLVFEEVFLRAARVRHIDELTLKKEAARLVSSMHPGNPHSRIMNLGSRHVLTTNYDYNLERGADVEHTDASSTQERKYSLYRRRRVHAQSVWHIHGEESAPLSLALGHDHYSGSLHHIRDYLVTRSKRARVKSSPFLRGDLEFEAEGGPYSWLDVFLRDDIHIYGFSMDYTEIDLWWLLSFKERLRLQGHQVGRTFFYARVDDKIVKREQARLAILESLGVEVVQFNTSTYVDAFDRFVGSFV